jgi:hypothetical protein
MTANILDRAIKLYLGRDPGDKVKKKTAGVGGDAEIDEWAVPENQPTIQELQQIYDDNIGVYNAEQEKVKKENEVLDAVKEKLASDYIATNNIKTLDDLEAL